MHQFSRMCNCVECEKIKVLIGINSQLEAIHTEIKSIKMKIK